MNGYEPQDGNRSGAPWRAGLWWWNAPVVTMAEKGSVLQYALYQSLPGVMPGTIAKGYPTRQAALQALGEAMGRAEKQ